MLEALGQVLGAGENAVPAEAAAEPGEAVSLDRLLQSKEVRREVFALARSHGVLPLLYTAGGEAAEAAAVQIRQFYKLFFATKYFTQVLEAGGVRCAVLKGVGAAMAFAEPELRKSGDVDILVPDQRQFALAQRILEEHGACKEEVQAAGYHMSYRIPGGICLELHSQFMEAVDFGPFDARLDALAGTLPAQISTGYWLDMALPLLRAPYQALSLLLHMLHHFRTQGFGLKLLCDWTAFWRSSYGREAEKEYADLIRHLGLEGFSALVTAACQRHLGLPPGLSPAADMDEPAVESFMEDLWEAGEFGLGQADRMIVVEGRGPAAYLLAFHRQMRLSQGRSADRPWLWPWLWAKTLYTFLDNNRKLRRVSLWQIWKKTAKRSRYLRSLRLFQLPEEKAGSGK